MSNQSKIATAFDTFNQVRLQSPLLEQIWQQGFGDEYAKEARPDAFYPQSVLDHIAHSVETFGLADRGTILDVGCGHGLTGLYLAHRMRCRTLFGIDVSPVSVELASHNHQEQAASSTDDRSLNATFWVADATSIDLADNSCGIVVCLDVILYFPDKPAAVREIARVLKPGGLFAFTTWEQKGHSERLGAQQFEDYRPLLQQAGLSVETYEPVKSSAELQSRVMSGLIEHESELRNEIGDEPAAMLVGMAKSAREESSERRYVLGIAKKLNYEQLQDG